MTKEDGFHETFTELLIRFTDDTYNEIKKSPQVQLGGAPGNAASILEDNKRSLRKTLHDNLSARILEDVLGSGKGGLFEAFIYGKKYGKKSLYVVDPHGVIAPEEVALINNDDNNKGGIWSSHHYSEEYKNGTASGTQKNKPFSIPNQDLKTAIDRSAKLDGDATTTVVAEEEGIRVLGFSLAAPLRVQSVTGQDGSALDFIQEDKNDDPQFAVVLPKPFHKGDTYVIRTIYSGKDAVSSDGGDNYTLRARASWFPNMGEGNYAKYHLTFRVPKGMSMAATGTLVREVDEGSYSVSEWNNDVPIIRAGFTFGKFKVKDDKIGTYNIQSRAGESLPDDYSRINSGALSTTNMMDKPLAEAHIAVSIYGDYFGPSSFHNIYMTQQTACGFGQS